MAHDEVLVSIDVEASGPSPSTGSLLSIGACLVENPQIALYLELKPLPGQPWSEDAERIHGLSRRQLEESGLEAAAAMQRLAAWLTEVSDRREPVFVGFNATFDWMFVADYFHRFLGHNPFGASGLDIKAYYMGRRRLVRWDETRLDLVARRYGLAAVHAHHALDDAREQARLMRLVGDDK